MRSWTHHEHQTQPILDRPPDPPSILLEPFFRISRLVLDHDIPDERVDRRTSRGLGHGFEGRVVGFGPQDETAYSREQGQLRMVSFGPKSVGRRDWATYSRARWIHGRASWIAMKLER